MVSDAVDEESKDEQDGKTSSQAVEDQNVRFWRKHGRVAVSSQAASTEGVWMTMEHAPVPTAILDNAVKWNLTV